ncbi:IGHM protein, partial [Polypterus senegalus]|nr:IGHM protein [Polypterus senegalus]
MVTVTSASPTAPTLFPLISTCGSVESSPISIGCLATGFTPSSLQFSWADDKKDLTNFRQFPSVRGNGETYMMSTQLSVDTADWGRGANFTCKAKHSAGNREKTLRKPDQTPPMPPTMFIASPSKDEIHINRTATMVCVAKGFYPKAHTFSWLKNDEPVTSGINNCPEALTPNSKLYHASSMLTVASSEWTQYNNNFTCVLEVNRHKYSASISSDPGCGPVQSVSLEIIPPSPEDMFTSLPNRHGDLSCIASNLNPEDSITFIWRENNDKEVHNETVDPELTDSIYTAKSKYTISFEQWSSRNKYECKVKDHSYIPFPISRTYTRDNDKPFRSPKIAIFPPPTYETAATTITTVTLTCFVKDFYPKEIFVEWNDNDSRVDKRDVATTDVIKHNTENNSYSVYSKLSVSSDDWHNGHSYSCIVYHERIGSQSSTLVRTIDISSEYFYDTAEGPEDDYDSLWTTASTFIILFFISLFYSIGATIFKIFRFYASVGGAVLPNYPTHSANVKQEHVRLNNNVSVIPLDVKGCTDITLNGSLCIYPMTRGEPTRPIVPSEIFLYTPPCNEMSQLNKTILACMVLNYQKGTDIKWNSMNLTSSSKLEMKDTKIEATSVLWSQIEILHEDWLKNKYSCNVSHASLKQPVMKETSFCSASLTIRDPSVTLTVKPNQTQTVLQCKASGFKTKEITFKCFKDGESQEYGKKANLSKIEEEEDGLFSQTVEFYNVSTEWNKGVFLLCQANDTRSSKISKCTDDTRQKVKPVVYLDGPNFEEPANKLTATCLVVGPNLDGVDISWKVGSPNPTPQTENPKDNGNGTQTVWSKLNISEDWKQGHEIVCQVKDACGLHETKTIKKVSNISTPIVKIMRPPEYDLTEGKANLICIITDFFPSDISVKWLKNQKNVSSTQFINDCPVLNGNVFSMVSRINITEEDWKSGASFTCMVKHYFSDKWQKVASPSNLFASFKNVDPKIILVTSKSEGTSNERRLLCMISEFSPKELSIKWYKDNKTVDKGVTTLKPAMSQDGLFSQTSQLIANDTEWKMGHKYKCEAERKSGTPVSQSIDKCTDDTRQKVKPVVYLDGPNFEEPPNKLTVTCLVVGPNLEDVVISWKVGSPNHTPQTEKPKDNGNGTQTVWSKWDISEDWKQGNEIVCQVKDACGLQETKTIKKVSNISAPILKIMRPPEYDLTDHAHLICIITNFFPSDISVKWLKNQKNVSSTQFINDCPVLNGNVFSMVSRINITEEDWKSGATFTCMVNHYFSDVWQKVASPSNLFASFKNVDPKINLVTSKSESTSNERRLLCMISEFSPKELSIKWYKDDQTEDKRVTTLKPTMSQDGLFSQTSQLIANDTEWKMGHKYKCEAKGKSGTPVSQSIDKCTDLRNSSLNTVVYLLRPSVEDDFHNKSLNATCMIIGPDLGGITVTWKVGNIEQKENTKTSHTFKNGKDVITSMLEKIEDAWKNFETIICEVKLPCNEKQIHKVSKVKAPKKPRITIFEPSEAELSRSSHVNLVCLINGFNPPDIFVQWKWKNVLISSSNYSNSEVTAGKNIDGNVTYTMYSKLQVEKTHSDVDSYSCIAGHESEKELISETITNVFKPIIPTRPRAVIFQSEKELICLVYGFSPKDIQVKWSLKKDDSLNYTTEHPSKGKDGKFTTNSRIQFSENEWLPGMVYTCSVVHNSTNTNLSVNISKQGKVTE